MSNLTLFSDQSLESMLAKAEVFIKSGLVPKTYNKPESVLVACTYGADLGFSPMQSLQVINVIEGKPCLSAAALQALALKHGGTIDVLEHTDKVCELEITRGERKHKSRFSVEDAIKQGLLGKSNWQKMPKAMLFARATSQAIRFMFADIVGGLYTVEELEDGKALNDSPPPKKAKEEPPPAPPAVPTPTPPAAAAAVDAVVVDVLPQDAGNSIDWEVQGNGLLAQYHLVTGRVDVTLLKLKDFCIGKGIVTKERFDSYLDAKRTKE